jgi:dTDP-4-amino-4,6-dideoxygalactose transaminase
VTERHGAGTLAVLGGAPAFAEPLHVGRPNMGDRFRLQQRLDGVLDRRWLTNHGPLVQEFEQEVAHLVGVRHCIAMCNATVALEVAARALGLQGEVIVPSYTFVASAHALFWQGITPVFCDIDPCTHQIDPDRVEALITPRTSGILAVHLWGRPCDVERLTAVASRHGLQLFFDAAHAFGCSRAGRMVGSFGRAEVFSFHATKFLNSCEGGAVVTDDDDLAERIRLMCNFGFAGVDHVVDIGTNGKMTEVCAAFGLTNIEAMPTIIGVNRENYRNYRECLAAVPGLKVAEYDVAERCNYQYVVVEVDAGAYGISRDELVLVLQHENVLARRYFWPGCHRMEPYRTLFASSPPHLPHTERVAQSVLVLPTGTAVTAEGIARIGGVVRAAGARTDEVRHALAVARREELQS